MREKIIAYLSPVLGEATAKNLLMHYCIKMHLDAEKITPDMLPQLAKAMRPMMAVWLGTVGAQSVEQEIASLGKGVVAK